MIGGTTNLRHPGGSRDPRLRSASLAIAPYPWVPAFAGMTEGVSAEGNR